LFFVFSHASKKKKKNITQTPSGVSASSRGARERFDLELLSPGGRDRLRPLLAPLYPTADACVLVFDATDEDSLRALRYWNNEVTRAMPSVTCVLVGTKADLGL
jgi:GTPase SAR1 family protein